MKFPALTILLLLLAGAPSFAAQERTSSGKSGSISGTVIDTRTSQPLSGVTVALHGQQASEEWNSATTAADGKFAFAGLVAGRYRLTASRNGYVDPLGRGGPRTGLASGTGTAVSLAAGQTVDDVVLRLTPTGVISGRIINERDEPMPGVFVQTVKPSYRSGHREFSDARSGFSDDRGEFRIWGLAPGQYYVRATTPRNRANGPAPREIYLPMFYPGVTDAGQTQGIELHPGEELSGINFNLSPSRAVHVRGRVLTSNAAPAKGAQVTLALQSGGSGFSLEAEADAAGKFDLASVPAGAYAVTAQFAENTDSSKPLMGRTTVQVSDTNLESVEVVIFPGATVSGRIRVEGDRKVNLARISASLKSSDASADAGNVGSAAVQADGTFVFHEVPEGSYRVVLTALPDGYYVKPSAGGDATEASLVVSHGHASSGELRLGFGAGRIQGIVYKNKNNDAAASSATVVLVPDGPRRLNSDNYREATADQSGKFLIGNIPPGDYLLLAWQDVERGAYLDPAFLQQYEDYGKPIHVEEGGSNTGIEVQLATARDSAR